MESVNHAETDDEWHGDAFAKDAGVIPVAAAMCQSGDVEQNLAISGGQTKIVGFRLTPS